MYARSSVPRSFTRSRAFLRPPLFARGFAVQALISPPFKEADFFKEKNFVLWVIIKEMISMKKEKIVLNFIPPILVFFLVFGAYLITAPRHAPGYADSDEIITAIYTNGILHPPGYPLLNLFGKPFTFLPLGSIAFRVSIFNSLFGALTTVFIYLTSKRIIADLMESDSEDFKKKNINSQLLGIIPSFVAALSLGFSYLIWLYSIVPEKYSIFWFFLSAMVYLMICWHDEKKKEEKESNQKVKESKYPYIITFVFGLTLLAHQTVLFLVPAFLIFAWSIDKKIFYSVEAWMKVVGFFLLSMIPNLYLLLAASRNPIVQYGYPNDLLGLYRHLIRYYYGGNLNTEAVLKVSLATRFEQLPHYFSSLNVQFGIFITLIALAGAILLLKKNKKIGIFVILLFLSGGPFLAMYGYLDWKRLVFVNITIGMQERIYIFSALFLALGIGAAVYYFLHFLNKYKYPLVIMGIMVSLLIPISLFAGHFKTVDRHNYTLASDYIENMFKAIEPNSIFIVESDMNIFGSYYYLFAEHKRQDITLIRAKMNDREIVAFKQREPSLFSTNSKKYPIVLRDVINSNIDKKPIYISALPTYQQILELGLLGTPYYLIPKGLVFKISKEFNLPDKDPWDSLNIDGIKNIKSEDLPDYFQKNIIDLYAIARHATGVTYLNQGYYDLAKKELEEAQRLDPDYIITKQALSFVQKEKLSGSNPVLPSPRIISSYVRKAGEIRQDKTIRNQEKYFMIMNELYAASYLNPKDITVHQQLAGLFKEMGWTDEAREEQGRANVPERN